MFFGSPSDEHTEAVIKAQEILLKFGVDDVCHRRHGEADFELFLAMAARRASSKWKMAGDYERELDSKNERIADLQETLWVHARSELPDLPEERFEGPEEL